MEIGQIVYNLEDYAGTGGLISTAADRKNIVSSNDSSYTVNKINIYNNIFQNLGKITKLGIQAPPGTKFYLNDDWTSGNPQNGLSFIVGRTGIYELDDNLTIDSLRFERPKKYKYDESLSENYINLGAEEMEMAKSHFEYEYDKIKYLKDTSISSDANKRFWEQYNILHNNYVEAYQAGKAKYVKGISGIYINNGEYLDLKNIIVDFMVNTETLGGEG